MTTLSSFLRVFRSDTVWRRRVAAAFVRRFCDARTHLATRTINESHGARRVYYYYYIIIVIKLAIRPALTTLNISTRFLIYLAVNLSHVNITTIYDMNATFILIVVAIFRRNIYDEFCT